MATLAVDPEKQNDPFYRYKMQRVITKIEGNGNGIKTVVPNISEIADKLGREVECLMKYFAHELAVTTKFKDDKWIMTGSFQQDTIQATLFDFVKKFVLCKECRNPETIVQMDEKKDLWLNCKACSAVTPIDHKEKLCKVLAKFASSGKDVLPQDDKGDKSKKSRQPPQPPTKTKDEKQEEKFQMETRQAKNEDDISVDPGNFIGELPNPVEVLREFVAGKDGQTPTEDETVNKIFDMKNDYGLDDKTVVALVFESLFDNNILKQIGPRCQLCKRFLKPNTETEIIINLMLLCTEEVSLRPKFAIILKKFYDAEVISEECILQWHASPYRKGASGGVNKESVAFFKEKAKPVVEWLREEEEDEEEEENKENGKKEISPSAGSAVTKEDKEASKPAAALAEEEIDIDAI